MSLVRQPALRRQRFHRHAYDFVFKALRYTQESLDRVRDDQHDERAHVTGRELLEGLKLYAREQYGLLARIVLAHWGIHSTDDVGLIVFELIDRGEMRKTEQDQLSDFTDVYDFETAFDREYEIDTSAFLA